MKHTFLHLVGLGLAVLPIVSFAQTGLATDPRGSALEILLNNTLAFTSTVLIPFIVGIAFLFFVWGMFQYFVAGGANPDAQAKGKSLMIYATLGFVLIIVFWGIINLLTSSTGLQGEDVDNVPGIPGVPAP